MVVWGGREGGREGGGMVACGEGWRREGELGGEAAPLPWVPPRGKDGSGTD